MSPRLSSYALSFALLLGGCLQQNGETCQIDGDCESDFCCKVGSSAEARGVCAASSDTSCLSAGGPVDAGAVDSGTVDSGSEDSGSEDASAEDAGGEDSGAEDAGSEDAGSEDSGAEDAGSEDAGTDDSGAEDAGSPDAGDAATPGV